MSRVRVLRLVALCILIGALIWVGKSTGLSSYLSADRLKPVVEQAGPWGIVIYYASFSIGLLVHVPGLVFVAVSMLVYGRGVGSLLALSGAVLAVCVSFLFARAVGGKVLTEIDRPLMKRILTRLDARPIRSVIVLRILFLMLPPLNYALALSNLRFRDYVVGSALGLAPPVLAAAFFFDWLYWYLEI